MRRGRLPLTGLRTFEVAGRKLSFTDAADELCVSQAAVSRQVRDLETWLGRNLFERLHRRVALTEAGRGLLAQLTASFDDIDRTLTDLRHGPAQTILTVSVEPAFAACWLLARLPAFRSRQPNIDVAVEADPRLAEFRNQGAELAIRYSETVSEWPRTRAEHLADVVLTPVLTPALLASGPRLAGPADLAAHTLLHEENRTGWGRWFRASGATHVTPARGPIFDHGGLVVQAALRGHGVALADIALVRDELEAGLLVAPFDARLALGAYWLVTPLRRRLSEPARAFAGWLKGASAPSAG